MPRRSKIAPRSAARVILRRRWSVPFRAYSEAETACTWVRRRTMTDRPSELMTSGARARRLVSRLAARGGGDVAARRRRRAARARARFTGRSRLGGKVGLHPGPFALGRAGERFGEIGGGGHQVGDVRRHNHAEP